jgi:hypothetical protein
LRHFTVFLILIFSRYRPKEYDLEDGPWDPISGGASALLGTLASLVIGVAVMPNGILRALKAKPAKATGGHNVAAAGTAPLITSRSSKCLTMPESSFISEDPSYQSIFFDAESTNPRLPSSEISANPKSLYSGRNRQLRFFRRLKGSLQQQKSEVRGMEEGGCFLDSSGTMQCLSPVPKDTESPGRRQTISNNHKECQMASKFALEKTTGKQNSLARILVTSLKFPMDFALHVARGFHNAPRLYGDDTVRPFRKIRGFKSGLQSSGMVRTLLHVIENPVLTVSRNLPSVSMMVSLG